jgi:hypothetical protein
MRKTPLPNQLFAAKRIDPARWPAALVSEREAYARLAAGRLVLLFVVS